MPPNQSTPSSRRALVGLTFVVLLCLGLLIARLYLSRHNTLLENGNWISTKATLGRAVMGAQSFVLGLQSLAGGALNLGSWHGFQEVISKEPFDPAAVEFDFFLSEGSYLTFLFNKTDAGYSGIRISKSGRYPPIFLEASPEGRFLRKRSLKRLRSFAASEWHTLRVEMHSDRCTVLLDDRKLKNFRTPIARPQKIGFRGGLRDALIDNLRVEERDGNVLRDSFGRPANWRRVTVLSVTAVLAISVLLFMVLRRLLTTTDKMLLAYFSMLATVLLVIVAMLYAFQTYSKRFYPKETERLRRLEEHQRAANAEEIYAGIEKDYSPEPMPGVHRLLFVGASQTWGAGATADGDSWVQRLERLLNDLGDERFECINTAVSAMKMRRMEKEFLERWLELKPRTVIINASHNDRSVSIRRFERPLTRLVEACQRAGIRILLIMEPNSLENQVRPLIRRHAAMARVAAAQRVPILDMHTYLAERHDDGFLWWDPVHLTSFGQRLFAERLLEELIAIELVETGPVEAAEPAETAG